MGMKWWLVERCPGSCTGESMRPSPRLSRTNWGKQGGTGEWERCSKIRFVTVNVILLLPFNSQEVWPRVEGREGTMGSTDNFKSPYSDDKQLVPQKGRNEYDMGLFHLISRAAELGGSLILCPGAPGSIRSSQRDF